MRRRKFITLLGSAAAAWPLTARAQSPERMRRVGVLNGLAETDAEVQSWDTAFRKRLDELGWVDGRNIHMDYRWGAASVERMHLFANELARLSPDVLFTVTTPATAAMQQETTQIPIVFSNVSDPIGSGFVASLANITGFVTLEASLRGKWLELMREIAPQVARVAFMFNPNTAPFARYYLDTFRSAASALAVQAIDAPIHSAAEIEAFITEFGQEAGGGLLVMSDTSTATYREAIIALANRYRLPTIYPYRFFAADGGLLSYGIVVADLFRGAASYIDRILRGAKPNELPVQLPSKFELIINMKAAKALGLVIPPALVARADEVIE